MTPLFFQTQQTTHMMMTFQDICLDGIPDLMDIQFSFAPDAFSQIAYKKCITNYHYHCYLSKIITNIQIIFKANAIYVLYRKVVSGTPIFSNKMFIKNFQSKHREITKMYYSGEHAFSLKLGSRHGTLTERTNAQYIIKNPSCDISFKLA